MINLSQQHLLGISAALVVLIATTLLFAIWQWHIDWDLAHEVHTAPMQIKTDNTANMIASLPEDHLFGKALVKIGEVPTTNLQLSVTGIVKMEPSNNGVSKAYISTSGQPGKIYQKGDILPSGVKIYDITAHEVILENNGQLEKLPLPREKLQFKPRSVDPDEE